ncbi:hypothetical protein ACUN7V_03890 [Quadrisphaera oryzae]|uniref:hypothetical protein n=1 Tax=Quadrisphaera TaxID=317661 RepID=UPI0016494B34|nr:hypothetical protein [Quadrisphaera sp. RL12-1S]MBC3760536.1 hypothetical protein [Quadrisphaera sp. RL12-1S]
MTPWRRGPGAEPGDLFLDPSLPDPERVAVSCGSWAAEATHVWTGCGWARLLTSPVRLVPGAVAPDLASTHHPDSAVVVELGRLAS